MYSKHEMAKLYERAKAEGRLCSHCQWMITIARWKKGHRLCYDCEDALKGVGLFDPFDYHGITPLKLVRHIK